MTQRLSDLMQGIKYKQILFSDAEIRHVVSDPLFNDAKIRHVVSDSRKTRPDYLFVATQGGHKYIDEAIREGAVAVVYEKPLTHPVSVPAFKVSDSQKALSGLAARVYGYPSKKMNVIGVKGSAGKSTTSYLIRSILKAAGNSVGLLGDIQNKVGPRVIYSHTTTPDADELQPYFAEMVDSGSKSAVMEISSSAVEKHSIDNIRFAAGIFTNLDTACSKKELKRRHRANAKFFEMLTEKSVAAINADDPASMEYANNTPARVIRYGLKNDSDISATVNSTSINGTRLVLNLGSEEIPVLSRLFGEHNVYNILAASACAWAMGYSPDQIRAGIETITGVQGRFEPVVDISASQDFSVFIDYAHTEQSLYNALKSLRPIVRRRIILVFGCKGERDKQERPKMGGIAEQMADLSILTTNDPRSENPISTIRDIEDGILKKSCYLIEPDRRAAIKLAIGIARKDDTVLIAGKGHETIQIFDDGARPFNDCKVAREILRKM